MKKGQSISINVIIIAALALIVLVVLIAIFTGRISLFGKGIDDISNKQRCPYHWEYPDNCFTRVVYGKFDDASANVGKVCCAPQ